MQNNKSSKPLVYTVKIVTIGDSGVGKTTLLNRFCEGTYSESHLITIGVEFKTKNVEVKEDKLHLEIWDTSGQERFSIVAASYYSKAQGIALCYAVDSKESFRRVKHWMEQVNSKARADICKILIATKVDLPGRVVSYEEGKELADQYGIGFMETSAKEKINVDEAFQMLAEEIHKEELHLNKPMQPLEQSQRLSKKRKPEEESSCCSSQT